MAMIMGSVSIPATEMFFIIQLFLEVLDYLHLVSSKHVTHSLLLAILLWIFCYLLFAFVILLFVILCCYIVTEYYSMSHETRPGHTMEKSQVLLLTTSDRVKIF